MKKALLVVLLGLFVSIPSYAIQVFQDGTEVGHFAEVNCDASVECDGVSGQLRVQVAGANGGTAADATFSDLNVTGQITGEIGGTTANDATFASISGSLIGTASGGDATFTTVNASTNFLAGGTAGVTGACTSGQSATFTNGILTACS